MEVWKTSVLTGIGLIILGIIFVILRGHLSLPLAIVIILGIIDVVLGLIRKKYRMEN